MKIQTYDLEKMKKLLHDFYFLTGIKICVYDSDENELCYYPEKFSPFCAALRKIPAMEQRCIECDRNAFAVCKKTRRQYLYTCHAGLLECVSPVLYGDYIIGYIAVGQIKTEKPANFTPPPGANGDSVLQLRKSFEQLPVFEREKIDAAVNILDACAGYEYLKTLINAETNRLHTRINEYIDRNIDQNLSVQAICHHFRLSKTELYEIFREYFSDSVAEFIKKRRLKRACDLLKTTAFSVNKIAKLCGIPDYNYFSKVFKRELHMSPSAFRKSYSALE